MTEIDLKALVPPFLLHSEIYYVVITDLEGRYIFTNEVFKKRFAFLAEDLIGKPFGITIHPDDVEKCNQVAYQCITNPDKSFQVQVRKPDTPEGDFYWTQWEFSLFKDQNKNPIGIFCLGYDITETERASRRAKEFAQKLDTIVEAITDGFYVLNRKWEFVKVNQVAEKILGKSRQELLGRKIWDMFPDTPEYNYPTQFRKAMNEYVIIAFEDYRADLDKWFSAICYPSQEGLSVFFKDITQEKKIQEQLKDSEYKLKAILDSTTDGNILVSSDYKIINFNKTAARESKEILGKSFYEGDDIWEFVRPEDKEAFWQDSQMALQGNILDFEKKIGGIWFHVRYFPVYDDKGKIFGFTLNASNIDYSKKAEEKLRQSEIMLRALYDSSNEAITLIDTNYKILYNNKLAKEITKSIFGREEQIGDYSLDFYIPELREEFAAYYQRVLQGETIRVEKEHLSIWWRFSLYPVYDNENKIFGIATNLKNITRRKQQDLQLQETQQRLDKTIEAIPHPLLIVDAETIQIIYVNAEFEKVFGYTEQEVVGREIDFLLPERYRTKHRFLQQEYLKKGDLLRNMGQYLPALIKRGTEIFVDASLNTFVADGKKYVIVILQDVTERKKQQDQILQKNKILEKIAWQQSHEVRRPVANILGLCDLLQNYKNEPEDVKDKYIAYLLKATQELDEIIHKIVELSNHLS